MDNPQLSERQQDILRAIASVRSEWGVDTTVREIQVRAEVSSPSVVAYNLNLLQERGLVSKIPYLNRTIGLTEEGERWLQEVAV